MKRRTQSRVNNRHGKTPVRYRDVRSGTTHYFEHGVHRDRYHDTLHKSLYATIDLHLQQLQSTNASRRNVSFSEYNTQLESSGEIWDDIDEDHDASNTAIDTSHTSDNPPEYEMEKLVAQLHSRIPRTNRDSMKSEAANWRSRRNEFVQAYMSTGRRTYGRLCECVSTTRGTIDVKVFGLLICETRHYHSCGHGTNVQKVIQDGFFPSTPERPSVAFSFDLLRQFQSIQENGRCSKEGYANGHLTFLEEYYLKELIGARTRHHFAEHFRDAHAHWLTVDAMAQSELYDPLNKRHRNLQASVHDLSYEDSKFSVGGLHEMCPACFGWSLSEKIESGHKQPAMILCLDGNMQHKRFKRHDDTESAMSHPTYSLVEPQWDKLPVFDPNTLNPKHRQTSNEVSPEEDRGACERHFHAADKTSMTSAFVDEPGVVLASCRHGSQLRLFNMFKGLGERRIYAVLLAHEIASTNRAAKPMIMYDIACQFQAYAQRMSPDVLNAAEFAVPALHGYAHQFSCQVGYHCRFKTGFGLSDGENVERNWSEMDRIVAPLRTSTKTRRIHALDNFIRSAARRKRLTFGTTLRNRWVSAQQRLESALSNLQMHASTARAPFEEHLYTLRCALADRRSFYNYDNPSPGTRTKHAFNLEPIDILFEHLCLSDQRAGDINKLPQGTHLPFRPSLSSIHAADIDYDGLLQRWQQRGDEMMQENSSLLDEILEANKWLDSASEYKTETFKDALGRKFSRELIDLRQKIWIKWENNMLQTRRLRAAKTGERGSTFILKCINKASLILKNLILKHNEIVDEMRLRLPNQPCHVKLDQSRLGDETEGPGFLLMPGTVMRHRWLRDPSLGGALDELSKMDRSTEELALLVCETKRLLIWYTGRATTLTSAMLDTICSRTHQDLLLQVCFFEARSFASVLSGIAHEDELVKQLDVSEAHIALNGLCKVLDKPLLDMNDIYVEEGGQDYVNAEDADILLATLQATSLN